MSENILDRLPRFDNRLGDGDISVLRDEDTNIDGVDTAAGEGLTASEEELRGIDHLEREQPNIKAVLDQTDIERIVQNLSAGLKTLEAQAQVYLHKQLTDIASCLFPKLAVTHLSAEVLAQISQIAGRLPKEVTVRVSPELAQQLDGQLEAAAGANIAVSLEATPTLDFSHVQLRWGAGGGDFNLNTLLEDILQKYAPATAIEET